jgi:phospholipid N-methyltransferase
LCFVREFFKYPKEVGTLTKSSKPLAVAMAKETNGSAHVVEFGAGTGSVTRQILRLLPSGGRLTSFEINPAFCKHLERIGDPRLTVINDDARNWNRYVDRLDCVVSGLPLALFGKSKRDSILDIASTSKSFIQLQYSPLLTGVVKNYFRHVKIKFVPLNLPPAFVFVCRAN